jgi:hypothetical protein
MAIEVLVIIKPNPGKEARVKEVIEWVTPRVQESETEVQMYSTSSTKDYLAGQETFFVYFRYDAQHKLQHHRLLSRQRIKSQEALVSRPSLPHHQQVAQWVRDEDLPAEPLKNVAL